MKTVRFLFSDQMARAIVEGRKTVTRRPVFDAHGNIPPSDAVFREFHPSVPAAVFDTQAFGPGVQWSARMPCAPGDLLIGRECWAAIRDDDEEWNESTPHGGRVEYRADHDPPLRKPGGWDDAEPGDAEMVHWRPSVHMPDWAARIRRRVLSVTVERVQDITEDEAVREGFPAGRHGGTNARNDFLCAWDDIYLNRGLASAVSPWVWRIEFSAENVGGGEVSDQRKDGIAWTDETWNPLRGCSNVSAGCKNCYAETMAARFSGPGQPYEGTIARGRWNGDIRLVPEKLAEPLRWKRPRRIFVNSMSDLFHEGVPFEYIAAVFGVMAACPQHTFQVLTKRPERAAEFFAWLNREAILVPGGRIAHCAFAAIGAKAEAAPQRQAKIKVNLRQSWPLPNVWLGVSVEDQTTADERIPHLLACPAAVRWASYEPALGPVDFARFMPRFKPMGDGVRGLRVVRGLQWLVVGGESGPNARPFDVAWARSTIAQCRAAGVACFVKQLGAYPIANGDWMPEGWNGHVDRLGVPRYGDRAGADPAEWPEDLRVREWPEAHR